MSRRDQIVLADDEVAALLDEERVVTCATLGRDGWPHLMPLWYVVRDGTIWAWTYGKSQKVRNLERDPRITALVETGDTYDQLQGVELVGHATLADDRDTVMAVGRSVWERYTGQWSDDAAGAVAAMGAKRVAIIIDVAKTVSWDHRKLGGTY